MAERTAARRGRARRAKTTTKYPASFDYTLLFVLMFIIGFGLFMICSTSSYTATMKYGDGLYYFKRQFGFTIVGLIGMYVVYRVGYHWTTTVGVYLLYGGGLLMVLSLPVLGRTSHGATRWLYLGPISIQPAEILKFGVICLGATLIARSGGKLIKKEQIRMYLLLAVLLPAALVYLFSQNLSSALIIAVIGIGLLFLSTKWDKHWTRLTLLIFIAAGAIILYALASSGEGGSFRLGRIQNWLHPEEDLTGSGYQTIQGLYAIGSGGLFGKGPGKSLQKLGYVPESQNDMIFSIICEELGLFGAIAVILLYAVLLYRIWKVAVSSKDTLGFYLSMGVFIQVAVQVIFNIAVVTNTMPNTGVSLPFISYGGSSAALLLAEFGVVLAVSRKSYDAAAKKEGQQS